MTARKDDAEKPRVDKLPFAALENVARVMAYGASKYGWDQWRALPDGRRRYVAAALRHLFAHCRGEVNDTESGLPHLWHAACSVLFAMDATEVHASDDDGARADFALTKACIVHVLNGRVLTLAERVEDACEELRHARAELAELHFASSCERAAREIGT
jgi:hypothetical protein